MKKHLLFILFISPLFSIAQSNFKPGYVINIKGDTLRGNINYREWEQNPKSIEFSTGTGNTVQKLSVQDIQYFEIKGFEIYQRFVVSVSLGGADAAHASAIRADTTSKTETAFLRVLQVGKNMTLYEYNDRIKERFYIKYGSMPVPTELIRRIYIADKDGVNTLITKNTFRGQLIVIASNVGLNNLSDEIQSARYAKADLVKIAAKINGTLLKKGKSSLRFFAGISAGTGSLNYTGDNDFARSGGTSTSIIPKISIGFDDNFVNDDIGRFALRLQLSVWMASFTNSSTVSSTVPANSTQELKLIATSLTPQLVYNIYNTAALKVYIDAGIDINFSSYPTNRYTVNYGSLFGSTSKDNYISFEPIWLSIPIKAGITLNKHFDIYGCYSTSSSLTDYQGFGAYINCYQIGINFFLGK